MASALHFGPAHVPSQESPQAAIEALVDRGYTACEIDFAQRFWMDYDFAARFGALAREHDIVLSVHAPIAGFMGHAERGRSSTWPSACSTTPPGSPTRPVAG